MSTYASRPVRSSDGRRIYVFAAVALAVFLLGIVFVGFSCHGFVSSTNQAAIETAQQAAAAQAAAEQTATEAANAVAELAAQEHAAAMDAAKAELEMLQRSAQQDYVASREASAAALSEFETAQGKFLDFVASHFGELTANIPTATKYVNALAEHSVKEQELVEYAAKVRQLAEQAVKESELAKQAAKEAAKRVVQPTPPPKRTTEMAANPQWTELRDKLEKLQLQRKKLLDTLTASHPAVVAVDLDITDIEQQLQTVPAQIATEAQPAEQPAPPAETPAVAETPPAVAEEIAQPQPQQPAIVPVPSIDLTTWAARWETDNAQFHELTTQLSAAKEKYRVTLQQEQSALEKQAEAAAAVAAFVPTPSPEPSAISAPAPALAPEGLAVPLGARPWQTIPWCGLAAAVFGFMVARRALVSEPVFRAAAAVRQALELPVLGILSRGPSQSPRETPLREPRWVRRTVLTAELWLVAIVLLLAATAWVDQQFWHDFVADPLAACSRKFFC